MVYDGARQEPWEGIMRNQLAAFAVLAFTAGAASAQMPAGHADLYYVPLAEIQSGGSDSGDGFGVRAAVNVLEGVIVTGEYQAVGYKDIDDDLTQYRIGAGLMGEGGLGVLAEYLVAEDASKTDGFGVHLRLASEMVYGQIGYLRLQDDDADDDVGGYEFTIGAVIPVTDALGAFVDVRRTGIGHDHSPFEIELTDVRAGVRFAFGGSAGTPAEPEETIEVTEPAE
jgi:hypothetical protein